MTIISALLWRQIGASCVSIEQFLRSSARKLYHYLYSPLPLFTTLVSQSLFIHCHVARGIRYGLLHTDRYSRYRRLTYIHLHAGHLIEARRPIRFQKAVRPPRSIHGSKITQPVVTMRPEFVTLNHHAVVGHASVVWGYAAWLVQRVLLDMLLQGDDGAWRLSHRILSLLAVRWSDRQISLRGLSYTLRRLSP